MLGFVEFLVYGLMCYTGIAGLIWASVSTGSVSPVDRAQPTMRVGFLMLSIVGAGMLTTTGPDIVIMETTHSTAEWTAPNRTLGNFTSLADVRTNLEGAGTAGTELSYVTHTVKHTLPVLNDTWILFHQLMFIGLILYLLVLVFSTLVGFDHWAGGRTQAPDRVPRR